MFANVLLGEDFELDNYGEQLQYKKSGIEISIRDAESSSGEVDFKNHIRKAEKVFKSGNHFLAIKLLENLKNQSTINGQYRQRINQLLPIFYQKVGFLKTAKKLYQDELGKNNRKVVRNLANVINKQSTKKSMQELERLSEKYPYSPHVFENMGKLQIKSKNFSDALNHYLRAYNIDRSNVIYLYNIGVLMEKMRKLSMAIMIYNKVIHTVNNASMSVVHSRIDTYRLLSKIDNLNRIINS